MAITRRQFVTRLGAFAAAVGMSQGELSKIAETFAYNGTNNLGGTLGKPRVVWIHGAECTGCSTSLLGLFEDKTGEAIYKSGITTGAAAGLAKVLPTTLGGNEFTYHALGYNVEPSNNAVNIVDLVVDIVDLQYHETVMGMGSDLAAQWLEDFKTSASNTLPFVLVVEGALQDKTQGGAWNDLSDTDVSWCSIGIAADGSFEHDMAESVVTLAKKSNCIAVIPIGQCATFGGYPGCKPPISAATAGLFDPKKSQTGAMGTYDYLIAHGESAAAKKVINVPGCPTNPWWFALTVVMLLVDVVNPSHPLGVLQSTGPDAGLPNPAKMDSTRRLKAVYPMSIHSPYCYRYRDYVQGKFAAKPGDPGCLQKIGCKGPATNSLCGLHGWNGQQPQNKADMYVAGQDVSTVNPAPNGAKTGGHCTRAGHPCMACTEKGYPDAFVPFIARS